MNFVLECSRPWGALSKKFKGRIRQELHMFNMGVCEII